ncbi:MAG: hypothetical protein P8X88_01830 [Gammaproteobacteria bacterium]
MPVLKVPKFQNIFIKFLFAYVIIFSISGCVALLLNGHLSFSHYEAKSGTFKCKLPGGALSSQLDVIDRSNSIGETVTFSLDLGLLWRIDHLMIGKHKLAMLNSQSRSIEERRNQLDLAKENYISGYLGQNTDVVEIKWEQFIAVNYAEVLIANTYVKWEDKEEVRELLFSIDGDYLNIVHYAQNVSSELQTFTTGAKGFYKSCNFF